jgi:REP element-mobilizing transposase RayT
MTDYRRNRVAGGTFFFTVNLYDRRSRLLVQHIEVPRDAVRQAQRRAPFHIDAWVVLPDHMHCLWSLPAGDIDFSGRWNAIKMNFSRKIPAGEYRSASRASRRERGIWQRRFGSIRSGMRGIMTRMWIISISIRLGIGWLSGWRIGRSRHFIGRWRRGFIRGGGCRRDRDWGMRGRHRRGCKESSGNKGWKMRARLGHSCNDRSDGLHGVLPILRLAGFDSLGEVFGVTVLRAVRCLRR